LRLNLNILMRISYQTSNNMIRTFRVDDQLISGLLGQQITVYGDFLYEHLKSERFRNLSIRSDVFDPLIALETVEHPLPGGFTFTYLHAKRIDSIPKAETSVREFGSVKSIYIYQNAQPIDSEYQHVALFDEGIKFVDEVGNEMFIMKDDSNALFLTLIFDKAEITKWIGYFDLRTMQVAD